MNKILQLFCAALLLCSTACFRLSEPDSIFLPTNIKIETVDDLYQFLTYNENRYPLISAHRGGPRGSYPENAVETFEHNAQHQASIIECDIRMTKDSVLVLMHDETLDRTSTGRGRLNQFTFKELQKLRLKDNQGQVTNYKIPTLEQALRWGKGKVLFTLDIKKDVPYELLIDVIRQCKAEQISVLITYSATQAAKVHQLAADLMISASIKNSEELNRLSNLGIPDNRLIAFIGTREADPKLYDYLHDHGILCILGTMGNLDKQALAKGEQMYAEYIGNGADILSTDRTFEAGKALNYYIKKRGITSTYIQ